MGKIYLTFQLVASICIAATLLVSLVRVTIECLDGFYPVVFGILFFIGIGLVKMSWKELKEEVRK